MFRNFTLREEFYVKPLKEAKSITTQRQENAAAKTPRLNVTRLGIVARSYSDGHKDFSHAMPAILRLLDGERCDAALFSMDSIARQDSYDPWAGLGELRHVRTLFLEEQGGDAVVYHRASQVQSESPFTQAFGRLKELSQSQIRGFVTDKIPKRVMGNCCLLLCGEINGVVCSHKDKPWKVHDVHGLMCKIPDSVDVILNPAHYRMIRPEMKLKRQFLSAKGRWSVSVWNKGKLFGGRTLDGTKPPWAVFCNQEEREVRARTEFDVEIGVLDLRRCKDSRCRS